ncbi:2378_t:CDS:2, partial [Racocetra fulgida]
EYTPGTPKYYIELAKRCIDFDSKKNGGAFNILKKLRDGMDSNSANKLKALCKGSISNPKTRGPESLD